MTRRLSFVAIVVGLLGWQSTSAHHTFAMFDLSDVSAVNGTVVSLFWKNPHVWLYISAPGEDDQANVEWGFEGTSIRTMTESGWSRTSLKPGDSVTVFAHPRNDGMPGGALVSVELPDGSTLTPRPARLGGE